MFDVFYSGVKPGLFAHEQQADSVEHAKSLSRTRYFWWITYLSDYSRFDFLFEPVPWESQYTHTWPSQWHEYSGTFLVPTDSEQINYRFHEQIIPNRDARANYTQLVDNIAFDYTWCPHPFDPPYRYIFGNQWYPANRMSTVEYCVPGAREIKYIFTPRATLLEQTSTCWTTLAACTFDYTWRPDPGDHPYRYIFGNQWHRGEIMPTVEYHVPGATEQKYMPYPKAELIEDRSLWTVPTGVDSIDFTWHPDPGDPPYIYQFGTQHQATGGPEYHVEGATEVKYMPYPRANISSTDMSNWIIPPGVDSFDWTWHPDSRDAPYRYQFGTQHQATGGPQYHVPGATEVKYITTPRANISSIDMSNWLIPTGVDSFDWTWHPDSRDPPYIYQFGTQHQATGGPEYHVPGATEVKYMPYPRANISSTDMSNWTIPENTNREAFDWTWHPDSRDAPYRYQFGTQWNRAGGPEYHVPGATEIKFVTGQIAKMLPTDKNWSIPTGIDINSFDFSWTPDTTEQPYIYQFGTQWQKTNGPCYKVPNAREIKYITTPRATRTFIDNAWESVDNIIDFDYTWHPDATEQPYIYQFGTQWQKTGGPRYVVSGATEVKYIAEPRANKVSTDANWIIPTGADIDSFDWTWHPDATDLPYIYQFGTQHQRTGGPEYHVPGATTTKYVDQLKIKTERVAMAIYEIDHMDGNSGLIPDTVKTLRYFDNYLDTLKRLAKNIPDDQEFVWICSSICDYTDFDFTWHPEVWQAGMLHVFPSDGEKFGDTFFMHVPTFKYRSEKLQMLDWYDLNFMDIVVPRRKLPIIKHTYDTHVAAVKTLDFTGPLAIFTTEDITDYTIPAVPLWREKTKTIVPLSSGASVCIVPKIAIPYIKTQLYDYPNIDRTQRHMFTDNLLDIVFIDNGEPNAEENYTHLKWAAERANTVKIHRSTGVNGRVAAYRAAAELSTTPWFFAVFAKLEVSDGFDWAWQPDRLQEPKHYIFHAKNPVNGLIYGHMSTIAYNKQLVLANTAEGLDFTLDQAHEVVPVLSGTANYHTDMWTCWRTAFRECIKLKDSLPDVENEYRLNQWLTKDNTEEQWSIKGAEDAVAYYYAVEGYFAELNKSYDWAWLSIYAMIKQNQ